MPLILSPDLDLRLGYNSAMAKVGRPSEYDPAVATGICDALIAGHSLTQICTRDEFPAKPTILKWLCAYPVFATQYARAREMQMELMAAEIIELSDDKSDDVTGELKMPNGVAVQRSRLMVDTRKWLMSKLAAKKYGDKVQTEISGPDGGAIQTAITVEFVRPKLSE